MNFVNEQNGVGLVFERFQYGLDAFLEVASVFGARDQGAEVQRVHDRILQHGGHLLLRNAPGQTFGDGGFSDSCFTNQQRIVLASTAQRLNGPFDFGVAADQRIDFSIASELVQIDGEGGQRGTLGATSFFCGGCFFTRGVRALALAGRQIRRDVRTRNALLMQEKYGVGILLGAQGYQNVHARNFLFCLGVRLHAHQGALNHPLEAQRLLKAGIGVGIAGRCRGFDVIPNFFVHRIHIGAASIQDFPDFIVLQKGLQQHFHRDVFVFSFLSNRVRMLQSLFQFRVNHSKIPLVFRVENVPLIGIQVNARTKTFFL